MFYAFVTAVFLCFSQVSAWSRIINGNDVNISVHPHQVSLQATCTSNTAGTGWCHFCGGSLISDKWVLTAAHCVDGRTTSNTYIGVNFKNGYLRSETYDRASIRQIIIHSNYNKGQGAYPNDIALIELTNPVVSTVQKPIALPNANQNFDHALCKISGWGRDETSTIPDRLQETDGVINPTCGAWTTVNYNSNVHICIDNPSTGSCNGDSGGPMVCHNVLAGVTSWGASGCTTSYPSVYARVSTYRDWIRTNTGI